MVALNKEQVCAIDHIDSVKVPVKVWFGKFWEAKFRISYAQIKTSIFTLFNLNLIYFRGNLECS